MRFEYYLKNVCTKKIEFDMDEDFKVTNIVFHNGCPGNTAGVARLADGRNAAEISELLIGIPCENNKTSCPDQFARVLREAACEISRLKEAKPGL